MISGDFGGRLRKNKSFASKEKQKWVIKEKEIKPEKNNRKRPCLLQRKNEN